MKIARFAGMIVLIALGIIAGFIAIRSYRFAKQTLSPPRKSIQQTPVDFNIEDYREVTFTSEDGIVLRGWYIPPPLDDGWIIIFTHGYGDTREKMLPEAQILFDAGHGSLLFDFRGHGESADALITFGERERLDLDAAIDFVDGLTDGYRFGALGFSMGAGVVAEVAASDERLNAVILQSSIPSLEGEINYRARAYGLLSQIPAMFAIQEEGVAVKDFRPIDRLCDISPRKVLLIYGGLDEAVPPGTAQAMLDAGCEPIELWEVPSAGHSNFAEIVSDEYAARLVDFFR